MVLLSNNFIQQKAFPTQINQKSATLIDNIFPNYHEHQCISSNLTNYISDHLPECIIVENLLDNIVDRNDNQIEHRDYKIFKTNAFKREIEETDCFLATENTDVNLGFEKFLRFI